MRKVSKLQPWSLSTFPAYPPNRCPHSCLQLFATAAPSRMSLWRSTAPPLPHHHTCACPAPQRHTAIIAHIYTIKVPYPYPPPHLPHPLAGVRSRSRRRRGRLPGRAPRPAGRVCLSPAAHVRGRGRADGRLRPACAPCSGGCHAPGGGVLTIFTWASCGGPEATVAVT